MGRSERRNKIILGLALGKAGSHIARTNENRNDEMSRTPLRD